MGLTKTLGVELGQGNAYAHYPHTDRLTFEQMWYIARRGIFWGLTAHSRWEGPLQSQVHIVEPLTEK